MGVRDWKALDPGRFQNPPALLLQLLLTRFSRVRLCATPQMAAHQDPPSLGLSRQEHWSGLPFPSPMHKSKKWKWSRSVVSDSLRSHGLQPPRLLCSWDFPGKSTGSRTPQRPGQTFLHWVHLALCLDSLCSPLAVSPFFPHRHLLYIRNSYPYSWLGLHILGPSHWWGCENIYGN